MRLPLTVDCPASAQRQRSNSDRRQQPNRDESRQLHEALRECDRQTCASSRLHLHSLSSSDALSLLTASPSHFVLYLEELPTGIFLFSAVNRFLGSSLALSLTPPNCVVIVTAASLLLPRLLLPLLLASLLMLVWFLHTHHRRQRRRRRRPIVVFVLDGARVRVVVN